MQNKGSTKQQTASALLSICTQYQKWQRPALFIANTSWKEFSVMLKDLCLTYFDSEIISYTMNATSDAGRHQQFFCGLGYFIPSSYSSHAMSYFMPFRNEQNAIKSSPDCLWLTFIHNFFCSSCSLKTCRYIQGTLT